MKGSAHSQYNDISAFRIISVLYVEDEESVRENVAEFLMRRFATVYLGRNGQEGLKLFKEHLPDVVITDIKMPIMDGIDMAQEIKRIRPETPVILITAFNEVPYLIKAIEIGVDKYIQKPMANDKLADAILACSQIILQKQEICDLRDDIALSLGITFGKSPMMKKVVSDVQKVARSDFSLVVQGETGTGKTLVAHAVHELSRRKDEPFIKVDLGTIPDTLVESELFGYEKGAFTGADRRKKGVFEMVGNGTLFIDELQNVSTYVQGKLLGAIEDKRIFPLGSDTPKDINTRIIAATNRDIHEDVKTGKIRQDLFFRLADLIITIPPLRERLEDLPYLVKKFLFEVSYELDRDTITVDDSAMRIMLDYKWPGNIRELKSVMRRAALMSDHNLLTREDVGPLLTEGDVERQNINSLSLKEANISAEKNAIKKALAVAGGNKTKAAKILDISYRSLLFKVKEYAIEQGN